MLGHINLVVGDMSCHIAVIPPACHYVLAWSYSANVELIEVHVRLYAIDSAIELRKFNRQVTCIVDDCRIAGLNLQVDSLTGTLVLDEQSKLRGLPWFYFLRQRVVANEVALHEISKV